MAAELGSIFDGLAAAGSVVAAASALWIATRDRRDRVAERGEQDRAQARLVLVTVRPPQHSTLFLLDVENFGTSPVLDVEIESAHLTTHPQADWNLSRHSNNRYQILQTDRAGVTFQIEFKDRNGAPILTESEPQSAGALRVDYAYRQHVRATVQFTDAAGQRWRTDESGSPRRVHT